MRLFSAVSSYQLLNMVCYRLLNKDDESCILLLSTWAGDKHPKYKELSRIFSRVVICDQARGIPNDINKPVDCRYLEQLLKDNGIDLAQCSGIDIAGAHFLLGMYCCEKKIPFTYWEDAPGLLSRPEVLADSVGKDPGRIAVIESFGLFSGNNPAIVKRVCNMNAQVSGFSDEKAEHFDVIKALRELTEDERNFVRGLFTDIEKVDIPRDSVLILTQHFSNLQQLSFDDHALIYQLFADYFFPDRKLVFKPHPDDLMYYSILFPGASVIRERFPSEFIPFISTSTPDIAATISSTAVFDLYGCMDNIFSLDLRFLRSFRSIHRYYIALRLLEKTAGADCDIETIGADAALVTKLLSGGSRSGTLRKIYIVDDISQSVYKREDVIKLMVSAGEYTGIFFINSREDYCFYDTDHKALWENILPVCIHKARKDNPEFFADSREETLYFYSKQKRVIEMTEKETVNKELKNTGIELSVSALTPEQRKIKQLEGMLRAAEERMLYYKSLAEEAQKK